MRSYRAAILTSSDSCAAGRATDGSGPVIRELLEAAGYTVVRTRLLPDERAALTAEICYVADHGIAELLLTTGGTGFSVRDCMPEATLAAVERAVPGIPEAMRAYSLQITPRAMLSRAVAGIRGRTLIVNLPGSPKAVRECLGFILPTLYHGLEMLCDNSGDCAGTQNQREDSKNDKT